MTIYDERSSILKINALKYTVLRDLDLFYLQIQYINAFVPLLAHNTLY